jgi:TPR repeat protein
VAADPAAAEYWYAEAAKTVKTKATSGNVRAQDRLGQLYLEGKGLPKDPEAGINWLNTAALGGYVWAQYRLGRLFERGSDDVQPNPTMAARYFEMAAAQGESNSMYALAKLYAAGNGVARDGPRAVELLQQSAAGGAVYAYAGLGDLYVNGDGLPKDDAEAIRWYAEGARHGDADAMRKLGEAYESGRGVPQDPTQALMWYVLSEQQDDERAGARVQELSAQLDPATVSRAEGLAEAWRRDNL